MFACFSVVVWVMFLSVGLGLNHETCNNLIFSQITISLMTVYTYFITTDCKNIRVVRRRVECEPGTGSIIVCASFSMLDL
jgi:hypothetical protein